MTDPQMEKKFEARIPIDLWREYETWCEGRGSVANGTLLARLLRCFLDLAEPTQLQILFGKDQPVLVDTDASYGDPMRDRSPKMRLSIMTQIARRLPKETIRLLGPDEQAELEELRTALAPSDQVELEPKRRLRRG